ncbi:hypothetical protein [Pandoraea captiosa]|nr:hypothetical protein [Pandoraea captiosa]
MFTLTALMAGAQGFAHWQAAGGMSSAALMARPQAMTMAMPPVSVGERAAQGHDWHDGRDGRDGRDGHDRSRSPDDLSVASMIVDGHQGEITMSSLGAEVMPVMGRRS